MIVPYPVIVVENVVATPPMRCSPVPTVPVLAMSGTPIVAGVRKIIPGVMKIVGAVSVQSGIACLMVAVKTTGCSIPRIQSVAALLSGMSALSAAETMLTATAAAGMHPVISSTTAAGRMSGSVPATTAAASSTAASMAAATRMSGFSATASLVLSCGGELRSEHRQRQTNQNYRSFHCCNPPVRLKETKM